MANEEDAVTESWLATLTPAAVRADLVAAAYAAGRAAGQRSSRRWGALALAMFGLAVGTHQWTATPSRDGRRAAEVVDDRPLPQPSFAVRPAELVRVEEAVLDRGLDGLPRGPRRAVFPDRAPAF